MDWERVWMEATYLYHKAASVATQLLEVKKAEMSPALILETVEDIRHIIRKSVFAQKRWFQAVEMTEGLRGNKRKFLN